MALALRQSYGQTRWFSEELPKSCDSPYALKAIGSDRLKLMVAQVALLFGSRARGEGTPDSDLDVLVAVTSNRFAI
jgi:predicted nucleotidyltransferase